MEGLPAQLLTGATWRTDGIDAFQAPPRMAVRRRDQDGVALVRIAKAGPHLLAADYKLSPSRTPSLAGSDLYNATFSFVAGEAP